MGDRNAAKQHLCLVGNDKHVCRHDKKKALDSKNGEGVVCVCVYVCLLTQAEVDGGGGSWGWLAPGEQ